MKSSVFLVNRKQSGSSRIAALMLAIAPLWLTPGAANSPAYAQTSEDASVSSAAASSPADWTQFHHDNMQRWNPYETMINASNADSLKLKWKNPIGAYMSGLLSSPAVVNGVIYFGSDDGNVYALNASTGAKLWSFAAVNSFADSSPAVANGVVYIIGGINIYALNASTGTKLWSFATGSSAITSPAVANGVVYVGSEDHNVYALNASTGAKLWSFAADVEFGSPAVANGVVYVGSFEGSLYALNATTGVKLWSSIRGLFYSSPAVANGVVYASSSAGDGNLYALNASTGAKLWSYATGFNTSSPTIVDGVLYIRGGNGYPSVAGNTYAFELGSADLFLRIWPSTTTVHQGDLITYAFPVWNLGPDNAGQEVLNTQVPAGTIFDYIRISGTPGLGTCTRPPYQGTGQIICHENAAMSPNTTWTVRLTVKVTASAGTVITANAATMSDTPDPNMTNNAATVSIKVQ